MRSFTEGELKRLEALKGQLGAALDSYNHAASILIAMAGEVTVLINEVREREMEYSDSRSARWHESDAGHAHADWLDRLTTLWENLREMVVEPQDGGAIDTVLDDETITATQESR